MKKMLLMVVIGIAVIMLPAYQTAQASLTLQGSVIYDGAARNLIYDSDLNLTWLDYSHGLASWSNQVTWASGLSLTFNGTTFDDWRLPATDAFYSGWGFDGTTTAGYNITNSEMGYLYYSELNNKGYLDTSGNVQSGYGLNNQAPFHELNSGYYWMDKLNQDMPNEGWYYRTPVGSQGTHNKEYLHYALAVRDGNVAPVPVPPTIFLLGSGLVGLAGVRRKFKE